MTVLLSSLRRSAGELARAATHRAAMRRLGPGSPAEPVALIGIYRRRNTRHVLGLVDSARGDGWKTAWWALDDVSDDLAQYTVGQGAGEKFTLLNEIIDYASLDNGWLVVADDDVAFVRGSAAHLIRACSVAELALAQPAQVSTGWPSHEITLSRALSVARTTTFVEIGPLFVVAPSCRDRIVPFPLQRGMGWGLELEWHELLEHRCRLGIVDAVTVKHLRPIGATYDVELVKESSEAELRAHGIARWSDLQKTLETWRPWQRKPPWVTSSRPSR